MKPDMYRVFLVLSICVVGLTAGCQNACGQCLQSPQPGSITIAPCQDVNSVQTQHVLVATVLDSAGKPMTGKKVEWMIPDGGVGTIVDVDKCGCCRKGEKITTKYAVSYTCDKDRVLDRGTPDTCDDIQLTKGQTWCVITSAGEGVTDVIAYCPEIKNWENHKAFAQKQWYDVKWELPPAATNPIDTPHTMVTRLSRYSDNAPLAGYEVTYKLLNGPAAVFQPGGQSTATVRSDANGEARVTLLQSRPAEGSNQVQVEIVRPGNERCCIPAVKIACGTTCKLWVAPKIAVTKCAPACALVGEEFQYGITVSNPSGVAAKNVMLVDPLPEGIQYVSSTPSATLSGSTLTWSLGEMPAQNQTSVAVRVRATHGGQFKNCAEATASYGLSAKACAQTMVTQAKLELRKEAPAEVSLCDTICYVVTVTNTGDAAATNVRIEDPLPEGLLINGQRVKATAEIPSLAPGQSRQFSYAAQASRTGTYNNIATATADHGLTAQAAAKVIVRKPELQVSKTGRAEQYIGKPVKYMIAVRNSGDMPAANTVLTDTLSANTRFLEASDGGACAGNRVVWNLGTLAVGETRQVSLTVAGDQPGVLEDAASAVAVCAEGAASAKTEIVGIAAILLECVDQTDPVEIGQQTTYQITVTNQGSKDGTNIVIRCTLPEQEQLVSADGPTKAKAEGKTVAFEPLPTLAPKASQVYRVQVKGVAAGDVRFQVVLTSDQMTAPVQETESTHIYE